MILFVDTNVAMLKFLSSHVNGWFMNCRNKLLSAIYYLHPGFSEARIIKTVTHCRPTLPHHLPQIKYQAGLLAVNGLYRHGYLIAPALAKEVLKFLHTTPVNSFTKETSA